MSRPVVTGGAFVICAAFLWPALPDRPLAPAEPKNPAIAVKHVEGVVHGFLVLRTADGKAIASGDLIQDAQGTRVTSRTIFHFADGSTNDETVVFTDRDRFRVVSDRLVQKGPTFPQPLDMSIDVASGQVTVQYAEKGESKVASEHMKIPDDLANGLVPTLLKNIRPEDGPRKVSMIAATPSPRLVTLVLTAEGSESFVAGSASHTATIFTVKVEIGGLAGLIAPLLGKQPPDTHVWILGGEAPTFVRAEGPLFLGGPSWRIELVSPAWRGVTSSSR